MKKVNILGTEYTIHEREQEQDEILKRADGYCDKTTKEIVIAKITKENCELHNIDWYKNKLLRHEIVHAFLFESGLHECRNISDKGHDEEIVDWFAVQSPKIYEAFFEVGCI